MQRQRQDRVEVFQCNRSASIQSMVLTMRQLFQIMTNVTTVVGIQNEDRSNTDDNFGTARRT